jgi:hypothetical protein
MRHGFGFVLDVVVHGCINIYGPIASSGYGYREFWDVDQETA